MVGMFDTQPAGMDKAADSLLQGAPAKVDKDKSDDPMANASLEQFNQHILLTAQAINRLRTNLFEVA